MWEHAPESAAPHSAMQQALQGTLAVHTFSLTGEATPRSVVLPGQLQSGAENSVQSPCMHISAG